MTVRYANIDDVDQMMPHARAFVEHAGFSGLAGTDSEIRQVLTSLLETPQVEVAVAEEDGNIVAGIGVVFTPFLWNPDHIVAEEVFWWSAPDAPKTAAMRVFNHIMQGIKSVKSGGKIIGCFKRLKDSHNPDKVE